MAHDNTGHIYINPPAGITVKEVGDIVGHGDICRSENINKWSKHKPVRYSTYGIMTDEMFKTVNYGFGTISMFSNTDKTEVFNTALSNVCDWVYLKPRENVDICRLLDFNGYRHDAINPLSTSFGEVSGHTPKRFYVWFTINSAADIKFTDFSFADSFDSFSTDYNYKYAVMVRKTGTTGTPVVYYGINVFKYENGQIIINHGGYGEGYGPNEIINFDAVSASQTETYDVVPCIIRHSASQQTDGNCIYLPVGQIYRFDAYSGTVTTGVTNFIIQLKSDVVAPTAEEAATGNGEFKAKLSCTFDYTASSWGGPPGDPSNSVRFMFRVKNNGVWGDYISRYVTISYPGGAISFQFNFGYDDYPGIPSPTNLATGPVILEVSVEGIPVLENYELITLI